MTDDFQTALQNCADEPAHIPGIIQPFGCLLAVDPDSAEILYASANLEHFVGHAAGPALGQSARDVLGVDAWHAIKNALSQSSVADAPVEAGSVHIGDTYLEMRVFHSEGHLIIELEPEMDSGLDGAMAMKTLTYLMAQIQNAGDAQTLFDLTVQLMQDIAGYDRVMVYRFDSHFNGQVVAEAARSGMTPFLGLHFPHWDIPAQARALMLKLPLRMIGDVDQERVPVLAKPSMPPLDMTHAMLRGVSEVHMRYLKNMNSTATMTLTIKVEGSLWGIVSFHHRRPRVPAPALRSILVNFLGVFEGKLLSLRQSATLNRLRALDDGVAPRPDGAQRLDVVLPAGAPGVLRVLNAHGISAMTERGTATYGSTPAPEVIERVTEMAAARGETLAINALADAVPDLSDKLGESAGALVASLGSGHTICVFRDEHASEVAWAGNPEKTIEDYSGGKRLSPRGSFSKFLDIVRGTSEPWTPVDIYLVEHLRTILQAAERQAAMDTLNRQQALMIGELNHRVRNILALVRSVSRQARRRYGSLDSYATAIENRVRALAAAHDMSSGLSGRSISVRTMLATEFEPFSTFTRSQTEIIGGDAHLAPAIAPLVALVFHELTTNAAKYGALSAPDGLVSITVTPDDEALRITWTETGGPPVPQELENGFGMAMIEQAIPHELGGTVDIDAAPGGVSVTMAIPARHLVAAPPEAEPPATDAAQRIPITREDIVALPDWLRGSKVLVLEDNFMIARELSDQLTENGVGDVIICPTREQAFEVLETDTPSLALLDVNLGEGGTSEDVAIRLQEIGVPFAFVTGYSEGFGLQGRFDDVPRLTKPISLYEIVAAVNELTAS